VASLLANFAAGTASAQPKMIDEIFGRIRERALRYWADPGQTRTGEINGRGMYFEDLNGLFLEIITRPYGSGN